MARTVTTGGGAMTAMWRSVNDDGKATELDNEGLKLVEPDPNDYVTPPRGTRAKLRISGISETFQMPSFADPDVNEDKVRVEFQIIGVSGKNLDWMKGKRFNPIYTNRVSKKSNLGLLFSALTGQEIPLNLIGYPYDGFIGTEFVTLIGETQSGHAKVNHDAIETDKTVLSPAVQAYLAGAGAAPQRELAGVAAGVAGDDPFAESDDL